MKVGLDVGYSHTKAKSEEAEIIFPSVVGTPDTARFSLHNTESLILLQPYHVQVGKGAIMQSRFVGRREDRAWIESEEWEALTLAALTCLTDAGVANVQLVTGLPVAFYEDDRAEMRQRLLGRHEVQRHGRDVQTFNITDCAVIPQPFGSVLSMILDDRGHELDHPYVRGNVGVIDVGGKTTNMLCIHGLAEIRRKTDSASVGAWDVVRAVREYLLKEFPRLDLRGHEIIDIIIARSVTYFGKQHSIGSAIDRVAAPLAEQIIAQATQLWGDGGAGLVGVLITGGGAHLLFPYFKTYFRHATMYAGQPVMGHVRGYYKLALQMDDF